MPPITAVSMRTNCHAMAVLAKMTPNASIERTFRSFACLGPPPMSNVRQHFECSVEIIRSTEIASFTNGGLTSEQLLFPENSQSQRVTITRVTIALGARNPPHAHAASEQVRVALRGSGILLLGGG